MEIEGEEDEMMVATPKYSERNDLEKSQPTLPDRFSLFILDK